jgi:integrase
VRPWEATELGAFLDLIANERLASLFEVLAITGLRRGEACGLRWADLDLESGRLVVTQQVVQLDGQAYSCPVCRGEHKGVAFGRPKTSSGEARRVELGTRAVHLLRTQRSLQAAERLTAGTAYVDHDLVFAREDGNPLSPERVTKQFKRLVTSTGLPPIRLHDLRHTRASLLLASGASLAAVSKILGHSTLTITSDTYSHLLEGIGTQAADAADSLVPRRLGDQSVTTNTLGFAAVRREQQDVAGHMSAPSGTRTPNPLIKSQLLCQLS